MLKYHLPAIGIAIALTLFAVATIYYPGGTMESANTIGYSMAHNFICSLFAPHALNGTANLARYFAIPAMLFLCLSLGMMFKQISLKGTSKVHKNLIEIGGIGSMVYSFLAVTPMHNLMVNIGLIFGLTALFAIAHMLYLERRWWLFGSGAICITLKLITAAMYYGNAFYSFLPVMQKVGLATCIGYISLVYYRQFAQEKATDTAEQDHLAYLLR